MPGYGLADWVSALGRAGCHPRKSGDGWSARCPSHDDKHPSLSFCEGDKREVVAHCHAGCRFEDIRDALGLDRGVNGRAGLQVAGSAPVQAGPPEAVAPRVRGKLPAGPGVSRYDYRDEEGEFVGVVIREDSGDGKRIRPFVPAEDGGGGWIQGGMPTPRPLYRLPELAQAAGAVEGEKCVEACLRAWPGKPAVTTWAHGTGSWRQTDWSPLAGRDVSLLADADEPGREAMREIAAHLNGMGCKVRLALPEGETGGDVADWIAADGADAALERIAELLGPFDGQPGTVELPSDARAWSDTNPYFRVLGIDENGDIGIRLDAGPVLRLQRPSLTSAGQLVALAPHLEWWSSLTGQKQFTRALAQQLGAAIIASADARGVYQLDADPNVAALADGRILDLRDGTTREPDRDGDRCITRRLGFDAIDHNEPTEWLNALRRLFAGDEIAWLQAWFGYSLTGHAREKHFLFVSGPRNGGKSTIVGTLARLAGGYHRSVPEDAFTNENQRHREYLARIEGARVVAATELAQGTWRSGVVKTLTGGGLDTVTANRMRENSRDFRLVAKLTFCGNNRLRIPGGADSGLAGRIINVTLPTIPDEQLDDRLNSKIESELPRIASWALEGARAYLDTGRLPAIPERWRESTSHYLAVEDTIGGWFDERCELQPRAFSTYQVLTEDFTQHTGERITSTQLGDWFDQRGLQGVRRHRTKSGRGIQGVALRPRIPQARRVTGDANDATSR